MSNQKVRKLFYVIDGIGYGEVRNIQRVSIYQKGVGWLFVFYREKILGSCRLFTHVRIRGLLILVSQEIQKDVLCFHNRRWDYRS